MEKKHYVNLKVAWMAIVAVMIVSCNDDTEEPVNVTLNRDLVSLVIGTQETLTATVTPNNAAVSWLSGNSEVATVENGVVRAVGVGRTVVNAKAGSSTAACDIIVTVVPVPVQSVSLRKTELTMAIGDKETLAFDLTPLEATSRKVNWSSSNPNVATVHWTTGEITAVALGEAVITVITIDGAKTASCTVSVVPELALKNPVDKASITLNLLNLEEKFTFAWETFAEIPDYILKFSATNDFETPFFTVETSGGSADVFAYDLNDPIKDRAVNPVPIYWTVEPKSSAIKVIPKINTLNVYPDRYEYLSLLAGSATGMQLTKLSGPYQYLMNTTGVATVTTAGLTKELPVDSIVLSFNYKSNVAVSSPTVSLYKSNGTLQEGPIQAKALSQSGAWKEWGVLIDFTLYDWGAAGDYLKLEFGNEPAQIEINGIHFRGISKDEYVPQILTITGNSGHTILTRVSDTEYIVETTANDPNVTISRLARALPAGASILTFEYKSEGTMRNNFQIFFAPPLSEGNSVRLGTVPPAADWTKWEYDATQIRNQFVWGGKDDFMRFDFGEQPGYTIYIRNIRFEYK